METQMVISLADILAAAYDLDIDGRPACVHASLRSFGHVDGGGRAVVDGLRAAGCTVLVPTFSWAFAVRPPHDMRPARNGTDYDLSCMSDRGRDRVFQPETIELDQEDMGAVPAAVLSMEGHSRGNHPLNSFAAVGPLATELIRDQQALDVYKPLEMLVSLRGNIVLMGVELTSMTLLHLAEKLAGRTLFRRWANGPDGRPLMVETGGCSNGFDRFAPLLAPLERQIMVGKSRWRAFPSRQTLEVAVEAIRADPQITSCGNPTCQRCADAVRGGPILAST